MPLIIDDRENPKVVNELLMTLGDASLGTEGHAKVARLKSGDYVFGEWGIEAKEINDLYHSIMGHGRSRKITAQLLDLEESFERPFLVVYGDKLKPFFSRGRRASRQQAAIQISRMKAVIEAYKQDFYFRHPKIRFMQLDTMKDFISWIVSSYRSVLVGKSVGALPRGIVEKTPKDARVEALMGISGINEMQAIAVLDKFGSFKTILRSRTTQKQLMLVKGITRNKAKSILKLRDTWP